MNEVDGNTTDQIRNQIKSLKAKVIKNMREDMKLKGAEIQSITLNRAFIQSGTLGFNISEDKPEHDSKSVTSNLNRNLPLLNDSQIRHYFGNNYSLLSITQKERMAYSIINQSHEANGNDVKVEDLLNIMPPTIILKQKTSSRDNTVEAKDFNMNLLKTLYSAKDTSMNYQQQLQYSFFDTSIRLHDEKKKDNTLHISFIEGGQEMLNVENLLKEVNCSNKVSERSKYIPLGMESLELSAIVKQCENSFDNPLDNEKRDACVLHRRVILNKSLTEVHNILYPYYLIKNKSFKGFFNKRIDNEQINKLKEMEVVEERKLLLNEELADKSNKRVLPYKGTKKSKEAMKTCATKYNERRYPRVRIIKSSSIKPRNANSKSLSRVYIIERSKTDNLRTPQKLRINLNRQKDIRVAINLPEDIVKYRATLRQVEHDLINPSIKTPYFVNRELKAEIKEKTPLVISKVNTMKVVSEGKNLRSIRAKVRPIKETNNNTVSPRMIIYRKNQLRRINKN